jgi:predicted nucleic acid-binding protein
MIFADLLAGSSVFMDANSLLYHFIAHPVFGLPCSDLLQRIRQQQLQGFTATHVLSEVAHRLMTLEACDVYGWPFPGIAQRLKRHPAEVQRLTRFRQAVEDVPRMQIQVLTVAPPFIAGAAALSQQTGLLSNDALIVAVMQANGLTNLASNDADFDRVPGLTRHAPL